MRPSFDDVYMRVAKVIAQRSTCKRRAVGCVIVDEDYKVLATGYNGVPSGAVHCIDVPCGGIQYGVGIGLDSCNAIHAEQSALMQCPDVTKIHTIYCTTEPCVHCSKMIANTSCKFVLYGEEYIGSTRYGQAKYMRYEDENHTV